MLISVATLVGLEPVPLQDLVKQLRGTDVRALEVNAGPTHPTIPGNDFGGHLDIDAVLSAGKGPVDDLLGDSGIRITALAPMLNLLDRDPSVRASRIRYFEKTIEAAVVLALIHR